MSNTEGDEQGKDLVKRTKDFALAIVRTYARLSKDTAAQVLGKQVLRSGTSVGAHYREATRARSRAEFISKIEVGLQELEETRYWLDLLAEAGMAPEPTLRALQQEACELVRILTASVRTAKRQTPDKKQRGSS